MTGRNLLTREGIEATPFYHRPPVDRSPLRPRSPMALGQTVATSIPAELTEATRVGYAVIGLETAGPSLTTDSILEVALVLIDAAGRVERSWSTLVDPDAGVDIGPTHIRGLIAEELIGAPGFDEVADLLVVGLAGWVVVAYNAHFDVGFPTQKLKTRGLLDRDAWVPRVCTMERARHFMTTPSRRLTTCYEVAGAEIGRHHSTLNDALAAAGLLRHYLAVGAQRGEEPVAWAHSLIEAHRFTGRHWDEAKTRNDIKHLTAHTTSGTERARPESESTGPTHPGSGPPGRVSPLRP